MNYKTVSKKKKKNTGLLVVALVLSLVLVGDAVAGIGYAFDWWNFGKEYVFEDIVFDLENKPTGVALMLSVDFETGKLTDEDIMELAFEGVTIVINDTAMCGPTASFEGDAFSIMISYHDKEVDFETFELVKFEKVADLEKEETCTTHVDENDDLLCDVCKANIAE